MHHLSNNNNFATSRLHHLHLLQALLPPWYTYSWYLHTNYNATT